MSISNFASKVIGDKKRWRAYKARVKTLPAPYRESVDAFERYLMHFGPTDSDTIVVMFDELADLFERAATDGTTIHDLVGDDPVEFIEEFLSNYAAGSWIAKERSRLTESIRKAEAGESSGGEQS
jgi:DNA-binding ferritin-like protein (Dps family)